ncbi:MAG TPA: SDR family oxidoreductase, partial [Stellaceae bacterium]|nr:SDR family oxidoreductase [Stellaceae bacterium]
RRFVEEGAFVYITGRRQAELDKAATLVGHDIAAVRADIGNDGDLDRLFAQVRAEKGRIDVLMANAGFLEEQKLGETTPDHFDKTFGINARGTYFTVQKALPLIRDGGSIILVSSIAAFKGFPAHDTYAATKAAVRSFARTWTAELKDRRIRVNTLTPGPIETPIIDTYKGADQMRAFFSQAIPLGRMGRPVEIANAALFLASDESSFVAGAELVVDGGMTAI